MTLSLGTILMTQGISARVEKDMKFNDFVSRCVVRHKCGDWGDLCEEDRKANEDAVRHGHRVFSSYDYPDGSIWIITEYDRSYTTVLLPEEY